MDRMLRALMLGALISATAAGAQTVYKSRNPDGSVVYSDMPPVDGKVDKIIEFADLPNSVVPPLPADPHPTAVSSGPVKHAVIMMHTPQGARVYQRDIFPAQPAQAAAPPDSAPRAPEPLQAPPAPVTLFSAVWCPYCRRAKQYLADHHVAYINVDIDTSDGRAAFDGVGGGGVPVLMSGTKKVKGFTADGYDAFFARR